MDVKEEGQKIFSRTNMFTSVRAIGLSSFLGVFSAVLFLRLKLIEGHGYVYLIPATQAVDTFHPVA